MRRLVTFPKDGPTVVGYCCSECYWRYVPRGIEEVYEGATFWTAQVLFERHDCEQFKLPTAPEPKPTKASSFACPLLRGARIRIALMDQKRVYEIIRRLERTAQLCESQAENSEKIADGMHGTANHRALAQMARAFHEEARALKSHMRIARGNYGEYEAERIKGKTR